MGRKGTKLTSEASDIAADLVEKLAPLGDVTSRKMFGGVGIFESGSMFALVTSNGTPHLKVDDTNQADFEKRESAKFGRMPYYEIPETVIGNTRSLRSWAKKSIAVAKTS